MKQPVSINREASARKSMDYAFLRRQGIEHVQRLSGDIWTDYNAHDPGVTILEHLCFGLTDLAYRTGFGIENLLKASFEARADTFYEAGEILPCNPLTLIDFRKLLIDRVEGIQNAWIEPVLDNVQGLRGLYRVLVQVEDDIESPEEIEKLKAETREVLVRHRNLGEDFDSIEILEREFITLKARISISYEVMGESVLGKMLADLEEFFNPRIRFYSMEELLEAGYSLNEILDGPFPYNGFIKKEDLKPLAGEIQISKLLEIISDIEGVTGIQEFSVLKNGNPVLGDLLALEENRLPVLDIQLDPGADNEFFPIKFFRSNIRYPLDMNTAMQIHAAHSARFKKAYFRKSVKRSRQRVEIAPASEGIESYFSIQRSFPRVYGIGEYGIPFGKDKAKEGASRQLKAYLLVFEQIMANYLGQLGKVRDLFSLNESVDRTYYYQPPFDVPDILPILRNPAADTFRDQLDPLLEELMGHVRAAGLSQEIAPLVPEFEADARTMGFDLALDRFLERFREMADKKKLAARMEKHLLRFYENAVREAFKKNLADLIRDLDPFLERRNRFLDHLLARFGETFIEGFTSYTLGDASPDSVQQDLIRSKIHLLRDYVDLSRNRGRGYDYLAGSTDPGAIPGLSKKTALLLNLPDPGFRRLVDAVMNPAISQETVRTEDVNSVTEIIDSGEEDMPLPYEEVRLVAPAERSLDSSPQTSLPDIQSHFVFSSANPGLLENLLANGIYHNNYQVYPNPKGKGISRIVTYQGPNDPQPVRVFVARNEEAAHEALRKLIAFLKEVNRQSEGFHMVDHVLLRPISRERYGFNLLDEGNNILLTSYRTGEKEAQRKFSESIMITGTDPARFQVEADEEEGGCWLVITDEHGIPAARSFIKFDDPERARQEIEPISRYLDTLKKRSIGRSRTTFFIERKKGYDFDGNVYSLRLSFIMPAWPMRFQSDDFRKHFEKVTRQNAPAHLNLNYYWLSIEAMKHFEDIFSLWLHEVAKPDPEQPFLDDLAFDLTRFLETERQTGGKEA